MSTKHKLDQVLLAVMNTVRDSLDIEQERIRRELETVRRSIGQKVRHQLDSVAW